MTSKLVYLYDKDSSEYVGEYPAQENPRRPGEYILPECYTDIAPPLEKEGSVIIYNVRTGGWDYALLPKEIPSIEDPSIALVEEVRRNIVNILFDNMELALLWIADQENSPRELRVARSQILEQRARLTNVGP